MFVSNHHIFAARCATSHCTASTAHTAHVKSCSCRKSWLITLGFGVKSKQQPLPPPHLKQDEHIPVGHGVMLQPPMTHFAARLIDVAVRVKQHCAKKEGIQAPAEARRRKRQRRRPEADSLGSGARDRDYVNERKKTLRPRALTAIHNTGNLLQLNQLGLPVVQVTALESDRCVRACLHTHMHNAWVHKGVLENATPLFIFSDSTAPSI